MACGKEKGRSRFNCQSCSTLKDYCKKSLDKLEEIRIQILNFCEQKLNVDPQNIIIQYTDQRQSNQLQPITQINYRSQQNQSQFNARNIQNQSEIRGDQQGQNQFLAERQIEEIRQTYKRDIERNERIYRSQLDFQSNQIDQLLKESSENGVQEQKRKAKKRQKQCIKNIEFQVNKIADYVKKNHENIWKNGLDQIFEQRNQEIQNIFKEYSNGFEQDIQEKANLMNEIRGWSREYREQEVQIERLKQQNQDYQDQLKRKEGSYDQLKKQLFNFTSELEQRGKDNQAIQLQFFNQEAEYDELLRQKNQQIEILQVQSNNSQIEFFTRQNDIKTFFQSIVSTIDQIKQNAPFQ